VVPDRNVLFLRMQELRARMDTALLGRVAWAKEETGGLRDRLRPQRFLRRLDERKTAMADLSDRLERSLSTLLEREQLLLRELRAELEGRSPRAVLARGYCVAEKDGRVVRSTGTIRKEDRLKLRFYDGSSNVIVERVDHDGNV
jgi:exodeoxyribonuclease VII large subunit